jgi:hypothetical protein
MHATLLLPSLTRFRGVGGILAHWVARGDHIDAAAPGRESALRKCFHFIGSSMPVAALTRALDLDDGDDAQWLRCDPAYVVADAVTLRLLACGNLSLSRAEAEALAQPLKPLFGDAGFPLEVVRPDRWYLRCAREAKLPKFSLPDDALGDDLARHMPEGDNAVRWRGLLNEAQIILTQHPLNAQRMQRGLPPVNSVWLWGAGILPQWVKTDFGRVFSDDETVVALARRAGAAVSPLPAETEAARLGAQILDSPLVTNRAVTNQAAANAVASPAVLVDLAHRRDLAQANVAWFSAVDAALKRKDIVRLCLSFESGERVVVSRAHRWRVWRRIKPLA